jgi:hypothetical protein
VKAADRNFVVVASRLPVDRVEGPDGETSWQPSPLRRWEAKNGICTSNA